MPKQPQTQPATFSEIPSWLEVPSQSEIDPPIETRQQLLPLHGLTWEDFERLCVRLVRNDSDIERCQLYGTRGQDQEGIDLFARPHTSQEYRVYQCKRYARFNSAHIQDAVETFLDGVWAERANVFVICTSASVVRTEYAAKVEEQHSRLSKLGLTLFIWDAEEISAMLKDLPSIVDDFFGRAWTRAFCGDLAADALAHRMDAAAVANYRKKLGEFYRYVFNQHDPGIPISPQPGQPAISLIDRYVEPELIGESLQYVSEPTEGGGLSQEVIEQRSHYVPGTYSASYLNDSIGHSDQRFSKETYRPREQLDSWLATSEDSVILGDPGSGKSSLLRYLAVDLFSDDPTLENISRKWARRLPMWLPFAYWTRLIEENSGNAPSISESLRRWLALWDQEELWPLIEQAIGDERLLLLVDGLDEWTNEQAGRMAVQMLQVFVETRNIAAVITSRPHGFSKIPIHGEHWQVARIAGLSETQQDVLCERWFVIKAQLDAGTPELTGQQLEAIRTDKNRFLEELRRSTDIADLARVPLLLLLLIYLHFRQAQLPRSRFQAYDYLIKHQIREHPALRRVAASVIDNSAGLNESEVEAILACLAFTVHKEYSNGMISEAEASSAIKDLLVSEDSFGLGLSQAEAGRYVPKFVSIAEGSIGLLVRQGHSNLSFFHRAFQEYLAAKHLSRMPISTQELTLDEYGADPRWTEVFLGLFSNTTRAEDIERLLSRLPLADQELRNHVTSGLRAEVAFGDFNCGVALARNIASEVFERIELGSWMLHRRRLLKHALEGLRSSKTREVVRQRVTRWIGAPGIWPPSVFKAISKWPGTEETVSTLWLAMHDEEGRVRRAAAQALGEVSGGNDRVSTMLIDAARRALDPLLRAASIEALAIGWPDHPDLIGVIDGARLTTSRELRIASITARVRLGTQKESDLDELIDFASADSGMGFGAWNDEVPNVLAKGWPGSVKLRDICLESARSPRNRRERISKGDAIIVLLRGFPLDDMVAQFCVEQIMNEEHPFLTGPHIETWRWLSENFRDHPDVVGAIDKWAPKQQFRVPEVSLAAYVGCTNVLKRKLIELLSDYVPHWPADVLLDIWGMEDPEVARALTTFINGPPYNAGAIAHLIPKILKDPAEARQSLLNLLREPGNIRRGLIITGLAALPDKGNEEEIVNACFQAIEAHGSDSSFEDMEGELIINFPYDDRVRQLAISKLGEREPPLAAISLGYPQDDLFRSRLVDMLNPLPTELRGIILREIPGIRDDDGFGQSLLKRYDSEHDDELKVLGSIEYHRMLPSGSGEHNQAVSELQSALSSYGLDHESRRRAAFAGLVVLDQIDKINSVSPPGIQLDFISSNLSLMRLVGEYLSELKSSLGSELPQRLSGNSSSTSQFWINFCAVAAEFPDTHEAVLDALEIDSAVALHPNGLRFLASVRPRSSLLAERCFTALTSATDVDMRGVEQLIAAADVLATNFGGDESISAALKESFSYPLATGLIITLCRGWRDDPIIDAAFAALQEPDRDYIPYFLYYALTYSRLPVDKLPARLQSDLLSIENDGYFRAHQGIIDPLVFRLRDDREAENTFFDLLDTRLYPSGKSTIPRAIAAAKGVSPDLETWCREELERQLNPTNSPQLGFDIFSQEVCAVAFSLLNTIEGVENT